MVLIKLILEVQHTFTTAVGLQQDCSSMKGLGHQLGPHGIYMLPCCKMSAVSVAALSRGRPRGSEVWKYVTFQAVEDVSQCQVKTKDGGSNEIRCGKKLAKKDPSKSEKPSEETSFGHLQAGGA